MTHLRRGILTGRAAQDRLADFQKNKVYNIHRDFLGRYGTIPDTPAGQVPAHHVPEHESMRGAD